jgi:small-conductance mechanosensitive channel
MKQFLSIEFEKDLIIALILWGFIFILGIIADLFIWPWVKRTAVKLNSPLNGYLAENVKGKTKYIAFFAGLYSAIKVMPFSTSIKYYLSSGALVVLVFVFTLLASKILVRTLQSSDLNNSNSFGTSSIMSNIIRIIVFTIGFLLILKAMDISIAPLLTALGVASLAVALALQDTLGNLFAGINVIAGRKIRSGDFIRLENGQEGYVEDISWRSMQIRELNNNRIIIPNQKIATAIVNNVSLIEKEFLIRIPISVTYDSNLDKVEKVSLEEASVIQKQFDHNGFQPQIRYRSFGDSGIQFYVILQINNYEDQNTVIDLIIRAIHKRFKEENIHFPFPTRTVYLHNSQE